MEVPYGYGTWAPCVGVYAQRVETARGYLKVLNSLRKLVVFLLQLRMLGIVLLLHLPERPCTLLGVRLLQRDNGRFVLRLALGK